MANIGFKPAVNDVVQHFARAPEQLIVGGTATPADMLPGVAVMRDVTDGEVMEATATGGVIGILGYARAMAEFKPATQTDHYNEGDSVPVYNGPGRALVYVTETVVKGDKLVVNANGQFSIINANIDGHIATVAQSRTDAGRTWINLTGV